MNLTNILFGMIIFSGIILGMTGFYTDMTAGYNQSTSGGTLTALNMSSQVDSYYNTNLQEVNATDGGLGGSVWSALGEFIFKAPVNMGKAFIGSADLFIKSFNQLSTYTHMPSWALGLITASISIVCLFAVVRFIWSREY